MKTIFSLPPTKTMPAGFYWEGDTTDSHFIDVYEFCEKICPKGYYGSSGVIAKKPIVHQYKCIKNYNSGGLGKPLIFAGDIMTRMGNINDPFKDTRFQSKDNPDFALYEETLQSYRDCFNPMNVNIDVSKSHLDTAGHIKGSPDSLVDSNGNFKEQY